MIFQLKISRIISQKINFLFHNSDDVIFRLNHSW